MCGVVMLSLAAEQQLYIYRGNLFVPPIPPVILSRPVKMAPTADRRIIPAKAWGTCHALIYGQVQCATITLIKKSLLFVNLLLNGIISTVKVKELVL